MKKILLFIVTNLVALNLFAQIGFYKGQDTAPGRNKYETAILDFSVQDVKLGMTLKEFQKNKKFTSEYRADLSDLNLNQKVYLSNNVPNITVCLFMFLDDVLYKISIQYNPTFAEKNGGWKNIYTNIADRFGSDFAPINDPDCLFLRFKMFNNISRSVTFKINQNEWVIINVVDTAADDELYERENKSRKLGF